MGRKTKCLFSKPLKFHLWKKQDSILGDVSERHLDVFFVFGCLVLNIEYGDTCYAKEMVCK